MSISIDTANLKKMFEANPLFKPASDDDINNRPKAPGFDHASAQERARRHNGSALGKLQGGENNDYVLYSNGVWIDVDNITVNIHRTDEGVVVDLFAKDLDGNTMCDGSPMASTYAYFSEADQWEDE